MISLIKELSLTDGASGREERVRRLIVKKLPEGIDFETDSMGNLIVHKKGEKRPKNKVMLCAHMDEVALIITYVCDDGLLKFDAVGGIDPAVLIGRTVRLEDGTVGVIALKHIHLCEKDEKNKIPKLSELFIDVGFSSKEETQRHVLPGDIAYFNSDFVEFGTGNSRIKAKALDDRVGCAFMIKLINSDWPYDIDFAFTVQEEIGARGALTATYALDPDIAVILEATTAGDICGVEKEKRACLLGEGPVISYMDRGTVYDYNLYRRAMKIAEESSITAQTKTLVAGGNDSQAVQRVGDGVRVMAVSVPCRYLHSPVCVIEKIDLEMTEKLLFKLVGELPND